MAIDLKENLVELLVCKEIFEALLSPQMVFINNERILGLKNDSAQIFRISYQELDFCGMILRF